MTLEPDPEQDRSVTERLDARHYGEPEDHRPDVAPPCDDCGRREAVHATPAGMVCDECVDRDEDGLEEADQA